MKLKDYHFKKGDLVTLSDYFIEGYVVANDDGTDLKRRKELYGGGKKFKIKKALSSYEVHGDHTPDNNEYYYLEDLDEGVFPTIFIYPEDFNN